MKIFKTSIFYTLLLLLSAILLSIFWLPLYDYKGYNPLSVLSHYYQSLGHSNKTNYYNHLYQFFYRFDHFKTGIVVCYFVYFYTIFKLIQTRIGKNLVRDICYVTVFYSLVFVSLFSYINDLYTEPYIIYIFGFIGLLIILFLTFKNNKIIKIYLSVILQGVLYTFSLFIFILSFVQFYHFHSVKTPEIMTIKQEMKYNIGHKDEPVCINSRVDNCYFFFGEGFFDAYTAKELKLTIDDEDLLNKIKDEEYEIVIEYNFQPIKIPQSSYQYSGQDITIPLKEAIKALPKDKQKIYIIGFLIHDTSNDQVIDIKNVRYEIVLEKNNTQENI